VKRNAVHINTLNHTERERVLGEEEITITVSSQQDSLQYFYKKKKKKKKKLINS